VEGPARRLMDCRDTAALAKRIDIAIFEVVSRVSVQRTSLDLLLNSSKK
jgi:hypothetical protein